MALMRPREYHAKIMALKILAVHEDGNFYSAYPVHTRTPEISIPLPTFSSENPRGTLERYRINEPKSWVYVYYNPPFSWHNDLCYLFTVNESAVEMVLVRGPAEICWVERRMEAALAKSFTPETIVQKFRPQYQEKSNG